MNATTFARLAQKRLEAYLARPGYIIPSGLGDEESACSIAAINLAIDNKLTDIIPRCMSAEIGLWVISAQDAMPSEMRNSKRWKAALVRAAGSGRNHEDERLDMLFDWMWTTVLPTVQPTADKYGFGDEWQRMCNERSSKAAYAAQDAIEDAIDKGGALADFVATAVSHLIQAIGYSQPATHVTRVAVNLGMLNDVTWERFDPIGLLERLIDVGKAHGE